MDDVLVLLLVGELYWFRCGELEVVFVVGVGGCVVYLCYWGVDWLVDVQQVGMVVIVWGCYLMVLWVGCICQGQFCFDGVLYVLLFNFGGYVIYGVGFMWFWQVECMEIVMVMLLLVLLCDRYWFFGGVVFQEVSLYFYSLQLCFLVQVGGQVMLVVLGWYFWFWKLE